MKKNSCPGGAGKSSVLEVTSEARVGGGQGVFVNDPMKGTRGRLRDQRLQKNKIRVGGAIRILLRTSPAS